MGVFGVGQFNGVASHRLWLPW